MSIKGYLYAVAAAVLLAGSLLFTSSTAAQGCSYANMPQLGSSANILCQAEAMMGDTQRYMDNYLIPAATERQNYLAYLLYWCEAGYRDACAHYNYEMQRQLAWMDQVIAQAEAYGRYR